MKRSWRLGLWMVVATVVLAVASTLLRQVFHFGPLGAVLDVERVAWSMMGATITVAVVGTLAFAMVLRVTDRGREQELIERKQVRRGP